MGRGQEVVGNDAFLPLANFWYWLKREKRTVVEMVSHKYNDSDHKALFYEDRKKLLLSAENPTMAAAYFFINRCSFSGATLSGGFSQKAAQTRFNQSAIYRLQITDLSNLQEFYAHDFEQFLSNCNSLRGFVYADPPYYLVGGLYGTNGDMSFSEHDHERLCKTLLKSKFRFALSYNDCPEIRDLYYGCKFIKLAPSKSMSNGKKSCPEVLILRKS
jgi:DNA adenine methylase